MAEGGHERARVRRRTLTVAVALVLGCALTGAAHAPRAQAQVAEAARAQAALSAWREGDRLLAAGNAALALTRFEAAYGALGNPRLLYNIGRAEAQLTGHEPQAFVFLGRFLAEAREAPPHARANAQALQARLRAQVALVRVTAHPSDARLYIDGADTGPAPLPPLALPPGTHVFLLRDGGRYSDAALVMIRGGEERVLDLRIKPALTAAAASDGPRERAPQGRAAAPDRHPPPATSAAALLVAAPPAPRPTDAAPEHARGSVLEKWWFWTAIGMVAAGAATAGVLLANHARAGGGSAADCPNATVMGCQGL